ncbi:MULTISPECIES: hypothetical protein [Streptomyces]|uniref:Uncharacterized protein n=1 Tax=Streptomyces xanthii TaxID=2768069 RepID=A0A7H1BH35_9ACTN|nr:hypothetical protein [Streptomyces xanthii]QNS08040.1 hypothetical protein IAG42_33465 [Streptomyces xanthii]
MPSPRPQWQNLFVAPVYSPDLTEPDCPDTAYEEPDTVVPVRRRAARRTERLH